ncbi:MAG: hypothetical protein WBP18_05050 [Paracoccaceae bacterium]
MRGYLLALLAALALPALALPTPAGADEQHPLTGEEFDALTRGLKMDTYFGGTIYGVEKFLPGGRSIWEDSRGCMYGTWKQVGDLICFTYEDDPANPDCWTYFDIGDGLSAHLNGDPTNDPIYLRPSNAAMSCNEYLGT